jgi:hypothetical protein
MRRRSLKALPAEVARGTRRLANADNGSGHFAAAGQTGAPDAIRVANSAGARLGFAPCNVRPWEDCPRILGPLVCNLHSCSTASSGQPGGRLAADSRERQFLE